MSTCDRVIIYVHTRVYVYNILFGVSHYCMLCVSRFDACKLVPFRAIYIGIIVYRMFPGFPYKFENDVVLVGGIENQFRVFPNVEFPVLYVIV